MKNTYPESLVAVHTHTHTGAFNKKIKFNRIE